MGEIDTKSIEAIQAAISFLGHVKIGLRVNEEMQKERELEDLIDDLENVKLVLQAKDSAYKQALTKLDRCQRAADELSNLLRKCDLKKQFYVNEYQVSNAHVNELEAAVKQMAHQVTESKKVQEQLSQVVSDLVSAEGVILNMEAQVAIMREARTKAVSQAEVMESALSEEKQKSEVLTRRVSETNEVIIELKKRVLEVQREKASAMAEKQGELELAENQTECMKKQLESMCDLENQLESNTAVIGSLQRELNQVKELHALSQKAVSDANCELKKLEEDLELRQQKNSNQVDQIRLLETELKQSRAELGSAHAEVNHLNEQSEQMKSELEKEQVEVALLKFELHKGKSKLAAAEARAHSSKSALHNMPSNQVEPSENSENPVSNLGNEHEGLINGKEVQNMKKELELATLKIGQLRTRAAQAISRAEAAEKVKAALDDQMRRSKERNVVIDEESLSTDTGSSAKNYHQPLMKVLDMKF